MDKITKATTLAISNIKEFPQFKETPTQHKLTPVFKFWLRLFGKKRTTTETDYLRTVTKGFAYKTSTITGYWYKNLFYITTMRMK